MSVYTKKINFCDENDNNKTIFQVQSTSNKLKLIDKKNVLYSEYKEEVTPSVTATTVINESFTNLSIYFMPFVFSSKNAQGDLFALIEGESQNDFNIIDGSGTTTFPHQTNLANPIYEQNTVQFLYKWDKDYNLKWYIKNPLRDNTTGANCFVADAHVIPDNNGGVIVGFMSRGEFLSVNTLVYDTNNVGHSFDIPGNYYDRLLVIVHYDSNGLIKYKFAVSSHNPSIICPSIAGCEYTPTGDLLLAICYAKEINHPVNGNSSQVIFEENTDTSPSLKAGNIAFVTLDSNGVATRKCNILYPSSFMNINSSALKLGHDNDGYIFSFASKDPIANSFSNSGIIFNGVTATPFFSFNHYPHNNHVICKLNSSLNAVEWYTVIDNFGNRTCEGWLPIYKDYDGYIIQNMGAQNNTSIPHKLWYSDGTSETLANNNGYTLFAKLNKNGKLVWHQTVQVWFYYVYSYSLPISYMKDNLLYIIKLYDTPYSIVIIDTETGLIKYTFQINGDSFNLIPIANDFAFFDSLSSSLISMTGTIYSATIPNYLTTPIPVTLPKTFLREVKLNLDVHNMIDCTQSDIKSKSVVTDTLTSGSMTVNNNCIFNGSIYNLSDIRVKQNISQIQNALDKVSKIGGYTYELKNNNEVMAGVIAQEVEKVLPEAVKQNGEYLTVSYDAIISLLIEAIKELKEKVDKN